MADRIHSATAHHEHEAKRNANGTAHNKSKKQEVKTRMTYDTFLEQMKKDLEFDFATELPDKYSGVKIVIRDVEKLQGESYADCSDIYLS